MTKPVNSSRRGTLRSVGAISGASTLVALVVEVAREAALPVLPLLQVVVDLGPLPLLAWLLVLPQRPVLAQQPVLADLLVEAELSAEEVSVEVIRRSLSAAMAGS